MTKENSNDSRRKLLKTIVTGSGAVVVGKSLPESWSKPIVDSVVLPVHAETTTEALICCEGVSCDMKFSGELGGNAAVSADCTITMSGDDIFGGGSSDGDWSGSGNVAADGTFSFTITFQDGPPALVTGSVAADCSFVDGTITGENQDMWGNFGGNLGPGSMDQCRD